MPIAPAEDASVKMAAESGMIIRLIGPMQAFRFGHMAKLPRTRKSRAVLAVLAMASPAPVPRQVLTKLMWSTRSRGQSQASLRQSTHEIKECLKSVDADLILSSPDTIALAASRIQTDIQIIRSGACDTEALVDLIRGPLLQDLSGIDPMFDAWIASEQTKLADYVRGMVEVALSAGEPSEYMMLLAERVVAFDPACEIAWRSLMAAKTKSGGAKVAREIYTQYVAAISRQNEKTPSVEMAAMLCHVQTPGGRLVINAPQIHPGSLFATDSRQQERDCTTIGVLPIGWSDYTITDLAYCLGSEIIALLSGLEDLRCVPLTIVPEESFTSDRQRRPEFDFLLEGNVQRHGSNLRLTIRLRELFRSGSVVWSRRLDRRLSDALAYPAEVVSAITVRLSEVILARSPWRPRGLPSLDPSKMKMDIASLIHELDQRSFFRVGYMLQEVLHDNSSEPWSSAWLAYLHLLRIGQGWSANPRQTLCIISDLTKRAISGGHEDASSLAIAGHVEAFLEGHVEEGLTLQERALSLEPELPMAWLFSGLAHTYAGDHVEAVRRVQLAKELSPLDPQDYFMEMALGLSYFLDGCLDQGLQASRNAVCLNPNFTATFKSALSMLGFVEGGEDKKAMMDRLLYLDPSLTVTGMLSRSPLTNRIDRQRFEEGLLLAGLPK